MKTVGIGSVTDGATDGSGLVSAGTAGVEYGTMSVVFVSGASLIICLFLLSICGYVLIIWIFLFDYG